MSPRRWLVRSYCHWLTLATIIFCILLSGCGGGISSQQVSTQPPGNFSLSVSSASVSVQPGGSVSAFLSAGGIHGFASQIEVQIGGLPSGVTVTPSTLTLMPGDTAQLAFSASASAQVANAAVTLTGTSGSLTHRTALTLAVVGIVSSNTPLFRMRYVRTDASTVYMGWPNSAWITYNPPTNRFFVTDPNGNRVYAIDAGTETVVGSIPVPGAFGIDDTPDHTTLYVGTLIGDVYKIDPVSMAVTQRYLASQIGPNGFYADSVRVMADGRLALLGGQSSSVIPSAEGEPAFAFWNPVDNSLSVDALAVCGPSMGYIGSFTRTPDRSKVVIGSAFSDSTLCEVDETGASQYVQLISGFHPNIALSPDGNLIAVPSGSPLNERVTVLDAHTLAQVSQFSVAGSTGSDADLFIGPDSKTLYLPASFSATNLGGQANIVYAYDLATGQQVGWLPNIYVQPYFVGAVSALGPSWGPQFQAMDGTGLLAGPLQEGVGFLDTTKLQTGAAGTQFAESGFPSPGTGPTAGGTSTSWWTGPAPQVSLSSVYFGSQKATSVSATPAMGYGILATISATTPPGAPGPADVYALATDGGIQYAPEGFSYGPTIMEVTPNMSTADGGGTGIIYGYGFGPTTATTSPTIPSGLQVTIGGQAATISAFACPGNL